MDIHQSVLLQQLGAMLNLRYDWMLGMANKSTTLIEQVSVGARVSGIVESGSRINAATVSLLL